METNQYESGGERDPTKLLRRDEMAVLPPSGHWLAERADLKPPCNRPSIVLGFGGLAFLLAVFNAYLQAGQHAQIVTQILE